MTTIGHTLFGLTLRNLSTPRANSKLKVFIEISLFAALANVPDWSIPGWGHDAYHISHSIFVLSGVMLVLTPAGLFMLRKYYTSRQAGWVWAGLIAAVLTHVFLDGLYGMGNGIAMFWPVSDLRLHMPVSWFHHLRPQDGITLQNLKVLVIEAFSYGTLFLISILARRKIISYISKEDSLGTLKCQH